MTGLGYLNPPGGALSQLSPKANGFGALSRPNGLLSGLASSALRPSPYELVTRTQTVTLERRVWEALDKGGSVDVSLFRP